MYLFGYLFAVTKEPNSQLMTKSARLHKLNMNGRRDRKIGRWRGR